MPKKKLKKYETSQRAKLKKSAPIVEASGIACSELHCDGEMMFIVPYEEHYVQGRRGEQGAIKSELKRAVCEKCGWRGWV